MEVEESERKEEKLGDLTHVVKAKKRSDGREQF